MSGSNQKTNFLYSRRVKEDLGEDEDVDQGKMMPLRCVKFHPHLHNESTDQKLIVLQKGDVEPKAPKAPKPKPQIEGVKVVIRRLPPGMTEDEFLNILGEEWTTGRGRVDWLSYVTGKISSEFV